MFAWITIASLFLLYLAMSFFVGIDDLLNLASKFIPLGMHKINPEDIARLDAYLEFLKRVPLVAGVLFLGLLSARKYEKYITKLKNISLTDRNIILLCGLFLLLLLPLRLFIPLEEFPFGGFFLSMAYFYLVIFCISLPLGLTLLRVARFKYDAIEGIIISFIIGFLVNVGIWAFFIALGIRLTVGFCIAYLLIQYIFTYILALYLSGEEAKTDCDDLRPGYYYLLVALFLSLTLSWGFYLFLTATPDADITSQAQIAFWIKSGENYNAVRPYLDSTVLSLRYPPGASGQIAVFSMITGLPINIVSLFLWLLSYPMYTTLLFILCRALTGNAVIAFISVILSLNSTSLGHVGHNGGQYQEMLTTIALLAAFYILFQSRNATTKGPVLCGLLVGASALTQPGIAFPYVAAVMAYPIIHSMVKGQIEKDAYYITIKIIVISFVIVLPWVIFEIAEIVLSVINPSGIMAGKGLVTEPQFGFLSPIYAPFGQFLLYLLSFIGLMGIFIKRRFNKDNIFLISWVFTSVLSGIFLNGQSVYFGAFGLMALKLIFASLSLLWIKELFEDNVDKLKQYFSKSFEFLENVLGRLSGSGKGKYAASVIVVFAWLIIFMPELMFHRFGALLTPTDYRALTWIKKNTPPINTLILNEMSENSPDWKSHKRPIHHWWASAVSERKSLNFRIGSHQARSFVTAFPDGGGIGITETNYLDVNKAYSNIEMDGSVELLQTRGITHVFLSNRETQDIKEKWNSFAIANKYVEKVYDSGGAYVFNLASGENM